MDCTFIEKHVIDIVERTIPSETAEKIRAHLGSCDRCAGMVRRFALLWERWEHSERIEPSPAFWFQVQRRVRESENEEAGAGAFLLGRARWLRPAAAAAILVVGVFVGSYLGGYLAWSGLDLSQGQKTGLQAEQLFNYYLGGLDDFPTGSVGEFYVNPGNNS
ncbi:MAG: hypothetical protein V2A71_04265 [Candidatus Eisenbacteria bacterium]